jgi:hypothetical protein
MEAHACVRTAAYARRVTTTSQVVVVQTTDVATTVLASFGVGLALLSLGWQAVSFRLSGSRVSVDVRGGAMGAGQIATLPSITAEQLRQLASQGMANAVFGVEVKNSGRSPTSVVSAGVVYTPGGGGLTGSYLPPSPPLPYRLEGESEATWYFDAGQVVFAAQAFEKVMQTGKPYAIRGRVQLGGRRKPVVSGNEIRVL